MSFNGSDGAYPEGSLIADAAGNLYGTTQDGGTSRDGTVFQIAKESSTSTTLVTFNGVNGAYPFGSLIADAAGNLFGTTQGCGTGTGTGTGTGGDGTVFEIVKGSTTATTLVSFNGSNGANPRASLIADAAGNLYGTTTSGGPKGDGTVFEISGEGFVAPPVVAITSPAAITNTTVQTIAGTVTDLNPGVSVSIYDNGATTALATATLAANGTWSANVTLPSQGNNSLVAVATDTAGHTGSSTAVVDVLDTVAPVVTITSAPVVTAAATQIIAGTATDLHVGSFVSIFDNGSTTALATTTVGTAGAWSTSVTLPVNGINSLVAKDTDLAGNTGSSAPAIDVLGPPPVVTRQAHPAADNATSATLGTAVTAYLNDALTVTLTSDADHTTGSHLALVGTSLVYTPGLVTHTDVGMDSISYTVTDDVTGAMTTQTETVLLDDSFAPIGFGGDDIVNLGGYNNVATGPQAPAASNGDNGPTIVGGPYAAC